MKNLAAAAAILALLAVPASAETCEALLQQVNKALESSTATAEKKEQAQKLRDQGAEEKRTGGDCGASFAQALQLLGE